MPLTTNEPIAFIPTANAAAARNFYETALGLNFVSQDDFALVFRVGSAQTMLRIVCAPQPFTPNPCRSYRSTSSPPPENSITRNTTSRTNSAHS